jgi:hypothetical protein
VRLCVGSKLCLESFGSQTLALVPAMAPYPNLLELCPRHLQPFELCPRHLWRSVSNNATHRAGGATMAPPPPPNSCSESDGPDGQTLCASVKDKTRANFLGSVYAAGRPVAVRASGDDKTLANLASPGHAAGCTPCSGSVCWGALCVSVRGRR